MVIRREVIEGRLKELAEILREFAKYQDMCESMPLSRRMQ
jgi:hypothetical protein